MAKKKMTVDFKGFEEMFGKLDKISDNAKKITEKALKESYEYITPKIDNAVKPHRLTGKTENSLRNKEKVHWYGGIGYINVGFDISNGGLPSIFLMYGTPKMKPDRNLYNAIYGSKTKKQVREIQEKVFNDELRRLRS